ncbi:MAG: acyl-CoA dehydrogenase, partial [Chromatiales bacterium]|nr:acyl-CoA dehydrogenase [Chromatiales bacterium]
MSQAIQFDPMRLPALAESLRGEVRAFLADEIAAGTFDPHDPNSDSRFNREFSRKVGAKGWIGMTWPKRYGGHERSYLERYVVNEEFLLARAPTRAHFTGDRQSGPVLMRFAPEHIRLDILPKICKGDLTFCIGMSEPDSGSDLFAAKTRAEKVDGG